MKPMNKRINILRLLCLALLMLLVNSVGFCADAVPLPTNINIVPPGPNVPEDLARLSGKWVGTLSISAGDGKNWGDTTQHVLIVEKIDEVGVITVIYARGDYQSLKWYPTKAFWARYKASWGADSKELMVSYPYENKQATIFYKLTADGKLTAGGQIGNEIRKYSLHRE
jgi:hypothetical protein